MTKNWGHWGWQLGLVSSLAMGGAIIAPLGNRVLAQIKPDSTLGTESSSVTPNVLINGLSSDQIDGGARRGANLFHSFRDFNIGEGRGAYFSNPAGIENILNRVTGANPSNILGTLGVSGGNANLFVLNPNGIIFGPNASLDIRGSFVATTADAIEFGNQGFFSAAAPDVPSLLTVNPSAFFFNQVAVQPITVSSRRDVGDDPLVPVFEGLKVPDGESLLLLGGKVSLDGGVLQAPGGRVDLGGVAGAGTVGLSIDRHLGFPEAVARADVSLDRNALLGVAAGNGGSITINARNLEVLRGSQLLSGIASGQGSVDTQAGDITLNATGAIEVDGESSDGDASAAFSTVEPEAVGDGGSIEITTGSLSLTNGARLNANTFGRGNAGRVSINARDISFDGADSNGRNGSGVLSTVEPSAMGDGGSIEVTTGSLSLTNGARLTASTRGRGNAGSVIIQASNISFDGVDRNGFPSGAFSNVRPEAMGDGGSIEITTGTLSLTNGARLGANTFGRGNAGRVSINVRDISFDGTGSDGDPSGVFSIVDPRAAGDGGSIEITTRSLSLTNGAQLGANTFGRGNAGRVSINARDISFDGADSNGDDASGVLSTVERRAMGNGGSIEITTGTLSLTNGARLNANTEGRGDAGSVTINARDISFDGTDSNGRFTSGAFSNVRPRAVGDGGNITITTGTLSLTKGARLGANTFGRGDAGRVSINARDISFDGVDSNGRPSGAFSAVRPRAMGDGGNIEITTGTLSLTDEAGLSTSSEGGGMAGNLEIAARLINLDNQAFLNSDTGAGQGNIFLNSENLVLRRSSNITTNATGTATGGNINIDTDNLVALENSDITANAIRGRGGNIQIITQGDFRSLDSEITASSEQGPQFDGVVEITTPDTQLQNSLTPLSANFVSPEQVVAGSCLARRNVEQGSFTVTGTGGLPRSPYEAISGQFSVTGVQPIQGNSPVSSRAAIVESAPWKRGDPIQEAQGMTITADGRTVVGTTPQLVALAKAEDLVCYPK